MVNDGCFLPRQNLNLEDAFLAWPLEVQSISRKFQDTDGPMEKVNDLG